MLIANIISLVAKLGGFSVVVGAMCKVFVDWYLNRKTAQYEKEIEILKHELSSEIEKSKSLNDQVSYKNKLLFDEEILIYKEIAPCVNEVKEILLSYIANAQDIDKLKEKESFEVASDILLDKININTFFMDEEIHNSFGSYFITCTDVFKKVTYSENYDIITEMNRVINQYDKLKIEIRSYLSKKAELF